MEPGLVKKRIAVGGMTCISCETRIEKKLRGIDGVKSVKAQYTSNTVDIEYDERRVTRKEIENAIEQLAYTVVRGPGKAASGNTALLAAATGVILLAVYLLLDRLGALNIFLNFPQAEEGMRYGMLFVIGLLTSLHCVAMCGGINLSQCVPGAAGASGNAKRTELRPSLLYNLGRVISYTVIGGIVGAIGQVVSFSGAAKGAVQLAAGVFMIIMGLNMLGLFPWLRKLIPHLPRAFSGKINREKATSNRPLYVGLLNGLMPCGPLQAMQLYALSAGSAFAGALSMLLFSLGTVPLMFGLGALSALLSRKFMRKMMVASAALVVLMGVVMFQNGMGLSGISLYGGTVGAPTETRVASEPEPAAGDVQVIETNLTPSRYTPITVQAGIPVRWTIHAAQGTVNGCNNRIIIPAYGNLEVPLSVGDNVIEFTPTETGVFPYSCWMGMIRSSITVVEAGGA